jgi:CcmD family protein
LKMDDLVYLCIAFAAVWAVFFIYLLVLYSRQAAIRRELDAFEGKAKESRRG